jgi:hypothetical protein
LPCSSQGCAPKPATWSEIAYLLGLQHDQRAGFLVDKERNAASIIKRVVSVVGEGSMVIAFVHHYLQGAV